MDSTSLTALSGNLDTLDYSAVIDHISDGAFLRDISRKTGIDKRRLSERLRKHADYPSAKQTAIEVQLDDAQVELQNARENTDITRAREMFRAAAWRAEREFPERWGVKQPGGSMNVQVVIRTPGDVVQCTTAQVIDSQASRET